MVMQIQFPAEKINNLKQNKNENNRMGFDGKYSASYT